ncbi:MAG: thiosulfate oxidation carrier complex protein SoxZ, partial [Hyphomicrobium sp.]
VKLKLSHPNHTGMVMNQQTLLYTPMKMVSEILVRQGGEDVLRVEGSIALSQDPQIEFDLKRTGATELEVTLKDTDNGTWTQMLPIGPQS